MEKPLASGSNRPTPVKRALVASAISAVALFLICYFIDNLPYSFVCDATIGQRIEQLRLLTSPDDSVPSDVLLVNVAYDRELVPVNDEFGLPKGCIDITDRSKLTELLSQLRDADYKYIILDVLFADEYRTPDDSCLFSLISSMDNLVVAKSETVRLADGIPDSKAHYSDYSMHIMESNFVKYEFVRNGETTLPYQVYLDLYGNRITSFCGFYFFNGKLANKSVVLRHPVKLWNRLEAGADNVGMAALRYYNLGCDILDLSLDIPAIAKNKIVVVGDFSENDMHDTYLGKIAGPVINLNALQALVNDNLSIPYTEILCHLLLYAAVSYYIIRRVSLMQLVPYVKNIRSKALRFIISLVGISVLFVVLAAIEYLCFGLDMNVLVPSLYFSVFIAVIKYRHNDI